MHGKSPDATDKAISTPDSASLPDGLFSQEIERGGKMLLVTWTRDEERRAVRKADMILLHLFSVSVA